MFLKDDQIVVTVDRVTFRSYATSTSKQFILDPDAIGSFWDGATVRRDTVARPVGWGDFKEKARRGTRIFDLSGTARATSFKGLQELRDSLMGICEDGAFVQLKIATQGSERYTNVSLADSPRWIRHGDSFATFSLPLYSNEPYLYGEEKSVQIGDGTFAGGMDMPVDYPMDFGNPIEELTVFVENEGNTPAWPKLKVTGNFPSGFTINDGRGSRVTYTGPISTSAPVTVDMAAGTAIQSGTDKSTLLSRRDWFSIPANGGIRPSFEVVSGVGWCDIIYRDTWI